MELLPEPNVLKATEATFPKIQASKDETQQPKAQKPRTFMCVIITVALYQQLPVVLSPTGLESNRNWQLTPERQDNGVGGRFIAHTTLRDMN